jgi:hypothetical protein
MRASVPILLLAAATLRGAEPAPLLVVLGPENRGAWEQAASARGWQMLTNSVAPTDAGIRELEAQVSGALRQFSADPTRVYLAGSGEGVSPVFLAVSRLPHLWAAAIAIEGNPRAAIQSNHLFGANSQLVPMLWFSTASPDLEPAVEKLKAASFRVEIRPPEGTTIAQALDWLAPHRRDPFPASIDCETGNPAFGRCYWLEILGFDPARRNDVLAATRVNPGSGASLDVGGFGYQIGAPGPGVEVAWLPPNYRGPLRLGDRIISVAGRAIASPRDYASYMDSLTEEKTAALMVERNKRRQRIETRIVLARRDELGTARVTGAWLTDGKELQIVSRGVSRLRVTVAPGWAPVEVTWNGAGAVKAARGGCWELEAGADTVAARACP